MEVSGQFHALCYTTELSQLVKYRCTALKLSTSLSVTALTLSYQIQ